VRGLTPCGLKSNGIQQSRSYARPSNVRIVKDPLLLNL